MEARGLRHLAAVALIVLSVATASAQDWNQWRGPSRTGVAAGFTAPAQWPDKPTRVWRVTVGAGHASPVVSNGRVFQLSRAAEQEIVTALDLESGKQVWQQRYDAPYEVNPAARSHGPGPKSTPVVSGGRLFTLGINGTLSAFDAASGKLQWRKQYAKEFDAVWPDFGVAMSPLLDNALLIVHVGGNRSGALLALDAATGQEKWTWKGEGPSYASPVIGTFGGTRQVITQSRLHLAGVNAADGSLLWRIPFTTDYDQNIVTPVIVDDLVIYTGLNKPLAAVRVTQSGGRWTPQPAWENAELPMYMSSPVAAGEYLFGLTHRNRGQFFCVDAKSGKTLWTTRGREGENAALVIVGDVILGTTTEGELVVARRDASKFDLIKRYTMAGSSIWAHPVPAGRGILIKDTDGLAYWTF
jgi:outer membrane protein assembly factor BamB